MSSLRMRAVATLLRLTAKPAMATADGARDRMRAPKGLSHPPAALRRRHQVTHRHVNGFSCYTVTPRERRAERAVLYLHGGAYISEIRRQHWQLISRVAAAGVRVEVPLYGLAPQHTHRDAYPFVTAVYEQLLTDIDATRISLAGDSAGAGLALGLAQTFYDAGLPRPGRLVLISPWLDLTLNNPAIAAVEPHDPWLSKAGLVEVGGHWAGGDNPTLPRLSPINGPLVQLPPVDVYIGTRDLFHPDVLRLRTLAAAAGTELRLTECEGAVHVYPLVPVPEGRAAAQTIVQRLSS
jgi:acetyl esterase/lipase